MKKIFLENVKVIFYALLIAITIRTLLFQPFYIPSSSMEPNLLVGDRLFVTKYTYGYSRHSLPFSPNIFDNRIFKKIPARGEIIVFKTPADNRTDYIKRLIGLPGDKIQIINGDLYLNDIKIEKSKHKSNTNIYCGNESVRVNFYKETLPSGKTYVAAYREEGSMKNTDKFIVPENHYFFMGDNRDCSKDSRFLSSVGYVKYENLVAKAQILFFSNDEKIGTFINLWRLGESLRLERFFKRIE